MAWTSVLGSTDAVLGLSFRLGAATESGGGGDLEVVATNTIGASSTAAANRVRSVSASSTLSLTQTVERPVHEADAESTLTLTQVCSGSAGVLQNSEISSLTLTSVATSDLRTNHQGTATSALSLTQTIEHNQKFGPAESELEVTQAVDQHGPLPRSASDTLDIQQNAHAAEEYELSLTSALSIVQVAANSGPLPVSASSVIVVSSSADAGNDKNRDAEDTISLVSEADGYAARQATSTLTLTQSAIGYSTQRVSNEIELSQAVNVAKPIYVSASNELVEYEETFDPDTLEFVTTETGLTQTASGAVQRAPSVHHYIQWTSVANGYADYASGITETAESILSLSQVAQISNPQDAENALSFAQVASAQVSQYNPQSSLSLTQVASAATVRASIAATSAIAIQQAVRFAIERSSVTCEYSPFVGATTDPNAPEPPSVTLPTVSELTGVRLLYPVSGMPTNTVLLRSPNFGEIDRLSFDRINRETRGGTLQIFADPIWPKIETLLLTFSVLTRDEADELLAFMRVSLGKEIRLIDWENRAWTGVIVNPQDPIVEDRRNSFTASFEFEGVRQTERNAEVAASSSLELTQSCDGIGANRVNASSLIGVGSAVAKAAVLNRSASSTLALSDAVSNTTDFTKSLTDTLSLSSTAGQLSVFTRGESSPLTINSNADCIYLQPLRTGDGDILLTGDGDPLEYR